MKDRLTIFPETAVEEARRVSLSTTTASERDEFYGVTRTVHRRLKLYFGRSIPNKFSDQILASRIFPVDRQGYAYLHDQLFDGIDSEQSGGICQMADYGKFILIPPALSWDKIQNEQKETYLKNFGSPEKAIHQINLALLPYLLSHELTHFYQNFQLPKWLLETHAYYCQHRMFPQSNSFTRLELSKTEQQVRYDTSSSLEHAQLFADLRLRYGRQVEDLMFGKNCNPLLRWSVLDSLTIEQLNNLDQTFALIGTNDPASFSHFAEGSKTFSAIRAKRGFVLGGLTGIGLTVGHLSWDGNPENLPRNIIALGLSTLLYGAAGTLVDGYRDTSQMVAQAISDQIELKKQQALW